MKQLICPDCNRKQATGKYCLDCGAKLNEVITSDIKFNPINSGRTADQLKRDVRSWLTRIGVQQPDIKINSTGGEVRIEYILRDKLYCFTSHMQDSITNNLAAVEQFLHYRVLGIERGIETAEQAFAGYEALPDYSNDPYSILGVKRSDNIEDIKRRFKELAKRFHPDRNPSPDAADQFQRIKDAMSKIEEEKK